MQKRNEMLVFLGRKIMQICFICTSSKVEYLNRDYITKTLSNIVIFFAMQSTWIGPNFASYTAISGCLSKRQLLNYQRARDNGLFTP